MASLYPATFIGADDLGRIANGTVADLVIFDNHYTVRQVFLKGRHQ